MMSETDHFVIRYRYYTLIFLYWINLDILKGPFFYRACAVHSGIALLTKDTCATDIQFKIDSWNSLCISMPMMP